MKPHEETLTVERFSHAEDSPHCIVSASDQRLVACFRGGDTSAWEALFTAAPDMARALHFMLSAFPKASSSAEMAQARAAARAALHKAGVPIP